jgi:hypothetical protein
VLVLFSDGLVVVYQEIDCAEIAVGLLAFGKVPTA